MADNQKETWIGIDDRPDNESPLRHSEPNRLAVTGLLLELIRGLFGEDGTNIINPALANYYWVPELQGTLEEAKNLCLLVEEHMPEKFTTITLRMSAWLDRSPM